MYDKVLNVSLKAGKDFKTENTLKETIYELVRQLPTLHICFNASCHKNMHGSFHELHILMCGNAIYGSVFGM